MIKVKVSPHEKLNISKGVIFCPDLEGVEETEILEELGKQNVKEIKRIISRKSGIERKTHLYILTFTIPTLPETINVGFQKLKIKMYVPNPIRCRVCLKFGHFADKCTKDPICGFCSKPEHRSSPCDTIVPFCVNCEKHHHSLDIKCPKLLEEKLIKTIQFKEKLPYNVAKRKYKESHPSTGAMSYADAARNSSKVGIEVGTQTDGFISINNCTKVIDASIARTRHEVASLSRLPLLSTPTLPVPPATLSPLFPPSGPSPPVIPSGPSPPVIPSGPSPPVIPSGPSPPVSPSGPSPPPPPSEPSPTSPSRSLTDTCRDSKVPLPPSGDGVRDSFKTPPLPRRNTLNRKSKKGTISKGNGNHIIPATHPCIKK